MSTPTTSAMPSPADMIERMNERLGFPDHCPHGWPISPEQERAENAGLQALSDLEAGDRCEIMRLVEHDGDLLHWYYDEGFVPGAELAVLDVQPAAGLFKVALGGGTRRVRTRHRREGRARPDRARSARRSAARAPASRRA